MPTSITTEMSRHELALLPRTRREAKALGAKLFFTGVPCKQGHLAPRYAGGGSCVPCLLASMAARHVAHREEDNVVRRAHHQRHKDTANARRRARYAEHREEELAGKAARWTGRLAEGLCGSCGLRPVAAGGRCRPCADRLNASSSKREANARRRAMKLGVEGNHFTQAEYASKRAELADRCYYSGATDNLQADHAVPLAWGWPGSDGIENVVPCAASLNASKGDSSSWALMAKLVERDGPAGLNPLLLPAILDRLPELAELAGRGVPEELSGHGRQFVEEFLACVAALRGAVAKGFEPDEELAANIEYLKAARSADTRTP